MDAHHDDLYLRKPIYRWLALIAALLAWGFDGVEQGVYTIMTRAALKDILPGITDASLATLFGLSMAMWLWGAALGGVLFGRLGDRSGRVRGLTLAVLTYATFTGLSALSTHWSHLVICRFIGAMGLGGTWGLCVALVVETWPEHLRAVLAGAIGCAANVGFFIAATYSRIMLDYNYGWRAVIAMGFLIGLASIPVILVVPEPTKWRRSRQKKERSSIAELFSPRFRRSTITGSLLSTVALLGTWGSFLWLATLADKLAEGTLDARSAKATISLWQSSGQIAGGFLGGLLAGWLGNKKSWVFLCLTAWASLTALFYFATELTPLVTGMAVLAGLFVTSFFGWLPKFLPELYPTRIRASGQGFSYNIGRILAGFGVLGTGRIVSAFHGDYRLGAMSMATVYLLGLIIIVFAPNTQGRMIEDEPASDERLAPQPTEAPARV